MANRRGHRGRGGRPPRGGAGNVLIEGDTGISAEPQGGAAPGASESGDAAAREFGVPQADIPGGLKHLVNAPAVPADTAAAPPRPADYHKEHGVPPPDWGDYGTPPTEADDTAERAPAEPLSRDELAVPVYIVEDRKGGKRLYALITEGPLVVPTGTADPVHLAQRDPSRRKFWITNETTQSGAGAATPGIRIGDWETTADGRGMMIPAAQMKDFLTQDAVYATNQSGTAITISWGYETEIPAARPDA